MPENKDILEENTEDLDVEILEADQWVEELSHCLTELEQENVQLKQQLGRLKADFENHRRRTKIQLNCIVQEANEQLFLDLLPVLDNFERALKSPMEDNSGQEQLLLGLQMVHQGLMFVLAKHGLEVIEARNQPFDPQFHDALSMEGEGQELVVLEEVQTGYMLNGKVLRHTRVLVGQKKEEDECQK